MRLSWFLWYGLFILHRLFILVVAGTGDFKVFDIFLAIVVDTAWVFLFDALLQTLYRHRSVWGAVFINGIYSLLAIFLLLTFGFAKLYQRPFTWLFIRTDSVSIWKENFVSAFYELGWSHLLLFILVVIFCVIIHSRMRMQNVNQRPLIFQGGFAVAAIFIAGPFLPSPAGLMMNPISAAFSGKPKVVALTSVTVADDDLVPQLESPVPTPFLRAVEFERVKNRNVILYFLESTPFSVVGKKIQGKEITPNINKFKERSLSFNRHYANFPLSINAFYNAFCGTYALPDGAWISLALPDFPVPCISEILGREGYRAIALHAGYLGYAKQKRFMQKRRFEQMLDAETIKKPPYENGMGPWGAADERAMIRPLVEFAAADSKKPFLAVLFAFAPHHPYNKPEGFPELIQNGGGLKKQQQRFYNSMHFADYAFGEIFVELEKKGVLKNSVVIVFGDHGEAFYEHHGNYNHPFFIYEENIHVPFFIYYDGIKHQEISRVTSHVDILPTVLDLLDLKKYQSPLHVGSSMLKAGPQTVAHIQAYWQEEFSGIVDARYKYIRKETGAEELFDLQNDAAEQENIIDKQSLISNEYRQLQSKAFAQKKAYYKKYGNYDLTRFNPASQDK